MLDISNYASRDISTHCIILEFVFVESVKSLESDLSPVRGIADGGVMCAGTRWGRGKILFRWLVLPSCNVQRIFCFVFPLTKSNGTSGEDLDIRELL